ncbi:MULTISPECIES: dihydroneopterin aldolase [unclassified Gilliamella]|uniref:dihydroneopterin aldolase n=1 Tax=unclassified Gilliamella TaxID=2685620 RepID=UPI00226ADBE7|nr:MULTISPECIES: dihydroneopterin aldolase [unclassified Gilliamella]MCX8642354.1 dihydroneopterin aldolase [Gilliamella sp. B3835]MCX8707752.1 dihydroneopterin aldolase [Gilliamella sp. B3783]MCX8709325.1 dihydroneopterin aldolase [Gilliamella sp. B3780]MCX8711634.1 dihydroneopterin aldolase [Gilliamella sp. B3468]MCX8715211.1 dihydroneopterin aldolase [Gilliamella sp. B3781]
MSVQSKDRVLIEGLTTLATIGVYEWEKTIKQKLILDLEMAWDNQPAGEHDDVALCLDYFKVSQAVTDFITSTAFELIESVAERVAQLIIQQFAVKWIKIKVSKPSAIANATNVAVVIERTSRF